MSGTFAAFIACVDSGFIVEGFYLIPKATNILLVPKNEEGHFHGLKERVKGTARLVWLSRVHRAGYRRRIFIFQEGPVPVLQSNK